MSHRFYGQETHDRQLQTYVFINTNAKVPAENNMYVISMNQQKGILDITQHVGSLDYFKTNHCDWTTTYLLCKDMIFNQMTDQTNYVRQNTTE